MLAGACVCSVYAVRTAPRCSTSRTDLSSRLLSDSTHLRTSRISPPSSLARSSSLFVRVTKRLTQNTFLATHRFFSTPCFRIWSSRAAGAEAVSGRNKTQTACTQRSKTAHHLQSPIGKSRTIPHPAHRGGRKMFGLDLPMCPPARAEALIFY